MDTDDEIAEYDFLHDHVTEWMTSGYWEWVRRSVCRTDRSQQTGVSWEVLRRDLVEQLCQSLRIPLPQLARRKMQEQISEAMVALTSHEKPLQVADYLLGNDADSARQAGQLLAILDRSKSAWTIGERSGRPGLVRRVPEGVQAAAEDLMGRAGMAGKRLSQAWESLYGVAPDPSAAYRYAILAVEDASIPIVTPSDKLGTLGKVISTMEQHADWGLPMVKTHPKAAPADVVLGMMRLLWNGQHDRHGGQPRAPGNVSFEEAQVAVSVAVPLVQWFHDRLAARPKSP